MSIQSDWQLSFTFFKLPVVVEPADVQLSSDAGLLPIRQFDEEIGFTAAFIGALKESRNRALVVHNLSALTRARIYGILADYPDQNDHDVLRSEPVFKLIAGRSPDDRDLASQPTHSRFENNVDVGSLWRLRDVLIDQFIASFDQPPFQLTLDMDVFDDPTHGQQQLTLFHGFYDQYQYLARAITSADNDMVLMVSLLFGTAHPSLGADRDLEYLVDRLRAAWPDVRVILRADSGYAMPIMYNVCERLRIDYTIGFKMSSVLKNRTAQLLEQAQARFKETGEPQRLFATIDYQAKTWPTQRQVIIKVEANSEGTNRRAIITNRPGARVLPDATYDAYADRGESENRNKELKCGLQADRLSDHRYMANFFRLYMHVEAFNLLVRLRGRIADPPPAPPAPLDREPLPSEALEGQTRRRYFNHRRIKDPLGEGHACTWRTRLIKVAAQVIVSSRRVLIRLSGSWPYLSFYRSVGQQVLAIPPPA